MCCVSLFKAACQTEVRKVGLMNRQFIYYYLVAVIIFNSLGFYEGLLCFLCMMTSARKLNCNVCLACFFGGVGNERSSRKNT